MSSALPDKFIGRKDEFKALQQLLDSRMASFVVLNGRRRIGKSRLIAEFAKNYKFYSFEGLAPNKHTTNQTQLDAFAKQLGEFLGTPGIKSDDWSGLFLLLAKQVSRGRVIILLDEISWMGGYDPDFLAKLKIVWEKHFKKNAKLIFILCGSVSTWIEKNILSGTGFLGRPTLYLGLEEMPLHDCNEFWGKLVSGISAYEKLKVLSVTGGIPRYLELVNPKLSAEENIRRLCFTKTGVLHKEFKYIFSDIFGKRSEIYLKIVMALKDGIANLDMICQRARMSKTGVVSEYLTNLVEAGFVSKDYTWHLKTGEISKLFHYRLKDNYLRFYLKYIKQNLSKIEKGLFKHAMLNNLPGWDTIIALQFENLVVNNHDALVSALGLKPEEIIFGNPFFQRKTTKQQGCQVDYLIQTKFNCVYVCEIKFSKYEITPTVIDAVKEKIHRLQLPRHFSYRPVLIHVNGVKDDVVDQRYFAYIVDFSKLLENQWQAF